MEREVYEVDAVHGCKIQRMNLQKNLDIKKLETYVLCN